jgi:hypothetical protein
VGVAAQYNFKQDDGHGNRSQMQQGARFTALLTWAAGVDGSGNPTGPYSLVGYTARMQLRTARTASGPPELSVTSAGGKIKKGDGTTFGAAGHTDGTILIDIPDEDTDTVDAGETGTTYYYDLELEDSAGNVERILEGQIEVTPNVTR